MRTDDVTVANKHIVLHCPTPFVFALPGSHYTTVFAFVK